MAFTNKQTMFSSKKRARAVSEAKAQSSAKPSQHFLDSRLLHSPVQIWKSRISWRITLVVFLTILGVQAGILYYTSATYEQKRLSELREVGRSSLAPLLSAAENRFDSPIDEKTAQRLLATTKLTGFAIYTADTQDLLGAHGAPMHLSMINLSTPNKTYRTINGNSYEVIYRPEDLNSLYYNYTVIARLDSSHVGKQVQAYIEQNIQIVLLMSAFVTSVLMVAMGHWLLEPILFLRENLIRASEDQMNPNIKESPFDPADEIGGAIELASQLIRQNAENILHLKTTTDQQIHELAYYDKLTGLPNRTLFLQTLNEMAREANIEGDAKRFAVVALDLDHFKDINDTMGHKIGDGILRAVGKRLRASLPDSAIVARSGEDEFAVTMALNKDVLTARDIAERIAGVIRSAPFRVLNENFQIRSSIGVSTYPDDGADVDQVLKNADIALNRAKEEGRDTIKEYSKDFDRAVQQRFQMLRDLRDALEHNQLLLYFQPQFDLRSGRVIGAEALLRWWKPDNSKEGGHFVSPADFIPVAEQSGLIVPIGEWVMKTSCQACANWTQMGFDIRIAVNVSGVQFYQSDIVAYTSKVLQSTGLEAPRLEVEVTESVFMQDMSHTIQTLQHLHELGVELAIDDFGTGYSSLSYLRQFPIDRLKIDQSFIRNALNNPDDASIARTIVRLGHSLNLKVIAEGVEVKEHEAFLKEEDCDEVQGFLYSKPLPLDKFTEFMTNYDGKLTPCEES